MNILKGLLGFVVSGLMVLGGLFLFYPSFYFLTGSDEGALKFIGAIVLVMLAVVVFEAVRQRAGEKRSSGDPVEPKGGDSLF